MKSLELEITNPLTVITAVGADGLQSKSTSNWLLKFCNQSKSPYNA